MFYIVRLFHWVKIDYVDFFRVIDFRRTLFEEFFSSNMNSSNLPNSLILYIIYANKNYPESFLSHAEKIKKNVYCLHVKTI